MMKRLNNCIKILLLLIIYINQSTAQPFEKYAAVNLVPDNFFEPDYIRLNNIKYVTLIYSEKRENQRIEEKDFYEALAFTKNGYLEKRTEYYRSFNRITDSIQHYYYRNTLGLVYSHRIFHNGEIITEYFIYDKENRLSKKVKCKETLENVSETLRKVQTQNILDVDSFSYDKFSDKQTKQHFYNKEAREFKSRILNYNEYKKISSAYETFKVTGVYTENTYIYDAAQFISEEKMNSNSSGEFEIKLQNKYENGMLTLQNKYLNNELYSERFLFYEAGLLDSELSKITATKSINIVKFVYVKY